MDEIEIINEGKNNKKVFSRVGWACFTVLAVATVLQLAGVALVQVFKPELLATAWFTMVLSFAPLYLAAFPLGLLILKPLPAQKPIEYKIGFGKLMTFLVMCFSVMYIGNIVGTIINSIIAGIKGTELGNPLYEILNNSNIYLNMIFVVILAPIFEELIFRKLLIDRVRPYGEGIAILVSGLMFGLFHGNLYQFFYAFGLGAMFAYIYVRTGKVIYTIILHAIINFFGGVLTPLIVENLDLEAISNLDSSDPQKMMELVQGNLPSIVGYGIYVLAIFGVFITGLVLLLTKRKSAVILPTEKQLAKGTGFKTVFLNAGMIFFVLLTLGLMTYTAIAL